jgi:tetratricopeptide (TPR) repeat protein
MRALLNSLGLTIWSSIAIVLAVGLALVGYRVSMNLKEAPQTAALAVSVASPPPASLLSVTPSLEKVTPLMRGQKFSRVIEPQMRAAQAALQAGRWQDVLDNAQTAERKQGITVFDTKTINHFKAYAHLQLHEPSAALTDFERVLATGAATPEETALISKTVSALQARVESEKNILPLPEDVAPAPESAAPSTTVQAPPQVALSNESREDYQQAVDAITRGLRKGSIAHLDEAYVYLGLAEQKLGNIAEARRAFAQLKSVPNISPRILKVWTLYADTLAGQAPTADSAPASREPEVAASVFVPASEPPPTPAWLAAVETPAPAQASLREPDARH